MAEQGICNAQVAGSTPVLGSNTIFEDVHYRWLLYVVSVSRQHDRVNHWVES